MIMEQSITIGTDGVEGHISQMKKPVNPTTIFKPKTEQDIQKGIRDNIYLIGGGKGEKRKDNDDKPGHSQGGTIKPGVFPKPLKPVLRNNRSGAQRSRHLALFRAS